MHENSKNRNAQPENSVKSRKAELNARFKMHKDNPLMEIIFKAAQHYIAEKEANGS